MDDLSTTAGTPLAAQPARVDAVFERDREQRAVEDAGLRARYEQLLGLEDQVDARLSEVRADRWSSYALYGIGALVGGAIAGALLRRLF